MLAALQQWIDKQAARQHAETRRLHQLAVGKIRKLQALIEELREEAEQAAAEHADVLQTLTSTKQDRDMVAGENEVLRDQIKMLVQVQQRELARVEAETAMWVARKIKAQHQPEAVDEEY